jgi:hypothetical protein
VTWAVIADSVAGTSHERRGVPCQDAFRFVTFGPANDWLLVAVADGAGSATHAEAGATLACDALARRAAELPAETLLGRDALLSLIAEVRGELVAAAARFGVPPRELACTALVAVAGPAGAAFAQVGDGAIVLGTGGDYRVAIWPEASEYANETDFLTDDRFADRFRFVATGPIDELAVLTDGLQRLALDYATKSPHAPFFTPLFARLRAEPDPEALFAPLRDFLGSPRVNARTDDDKTLVLAVRRP